MSLATPHPLHFWICSLQQGSGRGSRNDESEVRLARVYTVLHVLLYCFSFCLKMAQQKIINTNLVVATTNSECLIEFEERKK